MGVCVVEGVCKVFVSVWMMWGAFGVGFVVVFCRFAADIGHCCVVCL